MPNTLRYPAQQTGHFGKNATPTDASVPNTGDAASRPPAGRRGCGRSRPRPRRSPPSAPRHGPIHDLLLVPVDAFERRGDPAFGVEDVNLDAVPVHQRLDEVDPEPEVAAQGVDPVRRPQHSMAGVHSHAAALPVAAEAFGEIERRDRR